VDVFEAKAYENRVSGASAGKVVGEVRVEADDAAEAQLYTVGPSRVLRGGSWILYGDDLRCALRNWNAPDERDLGVGLRLSWES
jgi:formylglycine-generating enzyme required for sulfatase activity